MASEVRVTEMARSVARRPLPPVPPATEDKATLVLFYQYIEPPWDAKAHKAALKAVLALAAEHSICGRGRCAPEGLNCSLTGAPHAVRAFCSGLRAWNPVFEETDFKLTDGIEANLAFRALTIRKTAELVGYGLPATVAPKLATSRAEHVEADTYHELMKEKDTVIIDVRNHYEAAIGHFAPPEDGAEFIDPKLRNSHEFPKWLNAPETKAKLNNKKVMMYCTGGIRCERASALLDSIERAEEGAEGAEGEEGGGFKTNGVVMVRGGIERYLRTFPEGGFWRGKNYLFDRRFEQSPEDKPSAALEAEVDSHCCACGRPWDRYRGQFKCGGRLPEPHGACAVPVLVCDACIRAELHGRPRAELRCPLCAEG